MQFKVLASALAIATTPLAIPASAATHNLELTADPANLTTGTFTIGTSVFRTGQLATATFNPFTISQGDVIRSVLSLSGPLTVPGSMEQLFGLNFFQGNFRSPGGTPTTEGTLTFSYSGGPTGLISDTLPGSCGNCITAIGGQIPGGDFTFDRLIVEQTITALDQPFTVDNSIFSYQLRDVGSMVPEPGTWLMLIVGLGTIGAGMRRGRRALRFAC